MYRNDWPEVIVHWNDLYGATARRAGVLDSLMVTRYFALAEIMAATSPDPSSMEEGASRQYRWCLICNKQLFYNLQDILFNPTAQRY